MSALFFALLEIALEFRCPPRPADWPGITGWTYHYERVKWQEYARAVKPS